MNNIEESRSDYLNNHSIVKTCFVKKSISRFSKISTFNSPFSNPPIKIQIPNYMLKAISFSYQKDSYFNLESNKNQTK